jgi:hypothetical protein
MFDFPFKSRGKLIYDPNRQNMRNRVKRWAVLQVDQEISNYHRWWVNRLYHKHLLVPAWGAHVSVIRGERDFISSNVDMNTPLWKKYHNQWFEFEYSNQPYSVKNGNFWVIRVRSNDLMDIRNEMGLINRFDDPLHITIGKDPYKDLKEF